MSVQFGRWNFDGRPAEPAYFKKAGALLAPYGPDGESAYIKDSAGILFYAFHTTKESRRETQPYLTPSGAALTWDGRLDNRAELIAEMSDSLTSSATDLEIVAAAYEQWGTDCFAKLLGDWALAIWDPSSRSLLLAKDFVGTRHLYYSVEIDKVTWSSILDPLVLLAGKSFTLEEEYIAGWLSFFPATHLTPYVGIHAVPPSCFVSVTPRRRSVHKYWDFDPKKRIRYKTDGGYEEHFRQVFRESVRRRLRSDSPVLAELSGGMDSSSIVCMADQILARGEGETPRLDTLSYYDDSEPNWNERPYFTKVEEKRGRTGCHINVATNETFRFEFEDNVFGATPGSAGKASEAAKQFAACVNSQGIRVVLSGVGGDEVTGGVPTPVPELMDLIARGRLLALAHQLKLWALNKRKPWFHLLFETMREFFPPALVGIPKHLRPAPWLHENFAIRHRLAVAGYQKTRKLLGPLPSLQENVCTLNGLRRQLACFLPSTHKPQEKSYPYLDRNLLEFIYSVPRDQLVRPGQRRSLMRRSLRDLVPGEILDRKRKAYVVWGPLETLSRELPRLEMLTLDMVCRSRAIVNSAIFRESLQSAFSGREVPIVSILRTIAVEAWLRKLGGFLVA
jgi:asparagine synthase (glutamine-hydrolysing)